MSYQDIIFGVGAIFIGFLIGLFILRQKKCDEKEMLAKADKLFADIGNKSKVLIENARADVMVKKKQFAQEEEEFVSQLNRMEQAFSAKVALHQKREAKNLELRKILGEEERAAGSLKEQASNLEHRIDEKLMQIVGMPNERMKEQLIEQYEKSFREDAELSIQHAIEWIQECAPREGKNILTETICRYSAPVANEPAQKTIIVPRDEIKGRIVGRGGSNIAFFENLFGVDVIFNDEPNTIIVSCFNLVQREIACAALKRLMGEKNINEAVIARIKSTAEQDVEKILLKEGERALQIVELKNMPVDFIKLIGRLKFRTSYGQNILDHSFEVAYNARLLACEIGADPRITFIAAFFHDIGKAIDQEVTGSHDVLTKEILEKYNFDPAIIHAAWTHHNSAPQETVEARIVQAADALSASRPGARAESLERYLAKIKELEETANSFEGVKKVYAINAGREVRVIVEPEAVSDEGVSQMALNIAAKVEEKGGYPGKIKVTTIRTTKTTDYAR
ncbi:HD domain-containing protein [Candidatus Peregrinibacteria bacterium]|nr:HD domain-containing protein [Candidatus Peregrinibacteria bacterium]